MNKLFIRFTRKLYRNSLRKRLRNKDFTLLCNNCVAGSIYHQLGLRFNSPTINLYMSDKDFLYYCNNIEDFINATMEELPGDKYPVGKLISSNNSIRPITLFFMHYHSFEEARDKWFERTSRIKLNNLFILFDLCNQNNINIELLKTYKKINVKKILLYSKSSELKDEYQTHTFAIDFGKEYHIAKILDNFEWGQYFNQFDFIKWLNKYYE